MSDNPIKFTAGLTTAVLLIAEIENVEDTDNLRIQVCNSEFLHTRSRFLLFLHMSRSMIFPTMWHFD